MALISLQYVSLGCDGRLLLEEINFQTGGGERGGQLGRSSMGKYDGGWEKPIRQLHILVRI